MIGYILSFVLIICILLIFIKIQVELKIIINNGDNNSFLIIRALSGLIRLRLNLSISKDNNDLLRLIIRKTDSSKLQQTNLIEVLTYLKRISSSFKQYREQMNYMKSKISLDNLSLTTRIGTGDAATTAIITGCFMTVLSMTFGYINSRYVLKSRKYLVTPYFQGTIFDLKIDCIINFKIGHIIVTGIKMILKKLRW